MTTLQVRPMTFDSVEYVLARLSAADRAEMQASGLSYTPRLFMEACTGAPVAGVVFADGEPVAMFGVTQHPSERDCGIVWMVATEKFRATGLAGAKLSQSVVAQMRAHYGRLMNIVHAEHRRALRWLAWLGFRIYPEPIGPHGAFRLFDMEGAHV